MSIRILKRLFTNNRIILEIVVIVFVLSGSIYIIVAIKAGSALWFFSPDEQDVAADIQKEQEAIVKRDNATTDNMFLPLSSEEKDLDDAYQIWILENNNLYSASPDIIFSALQELMDIAFRGHAKAQLTVAAIYINEGDYEDAAYWLLESAEQGNADAQLSLGNMYKNGKGVSQDDAEAVRWLRKSAEQGLAEAQFNLSLMYKFGMGVSQHEAQSFRWTRKAAEQGLAEAQFNLGIMYIKGKGVPQNYTESAMWIRKAANQGLAAAQFNLGNMYDNGIGVARDISMAIIWYTKATEQGYAMALEFLYAAKQKQLLLQAIGVINDNDW